MQLKYASIIFICTKQIYEQFDQFAINSLFIQLIVALNCGSQSRLNTYIVTSTSHTISIFHCYFLQVYLRISSKFYSSNFSSCLLILSLLFPIKVLLAILLNLIIRSYMYYPCNLSFSCSNTVIITVMYLKSQIL